MPSNSESILTAISPAAASLLQAMAESRSRWKLLDSSPYNADYKMYVVLPSSGGSSGSDDHTRRLNAATSSVISQATTIGRLFTKPWTTGFGGKIVPGGILAKGLSSSSLPSSSRRELEGRVAGYLHAAPRAISQALFDVDGELFILGSGRAALGLGAAASGAKGRGATATRHRAASEEASVIFAPTVLERIGDKELIVLLYKRLTTSSMAVAELLYRVEVKYGFDDDEVVLHFEPIELEKVVEKKGGVVDAKRRSVIANNYSIISGRETGCLMLTRDELGCSRTEMAFRGQYEVDLHEAAHCILLKNVFSPIKSAQKMHEKCDEIDALRRKYFVNVTLANAPQLCPPEAKLLAEYSNLLNLGVKSGEDGEVFARLRGSVIKHPTIAMFGRRDGKGEVWGKVVGRVDASADVVIAYLWDFMSYGRTRTFYEENGNLLRYEKALEKSRSKIMAASKKFPKGVENRFFKNVWVWDRKRPSGGGDGDYFAYTLAFGPAEEYALTSLFEKPFEAAEHERAVSVRGNMRGVYKVVSVAAGLCEATLIQTADLGGSIPSWVTTYSLSGHLLAVLKLQDYFRRPDRVVDKEMRESISARIKASCCEIPARDKDHYDSCCWLKEAFEAEDTRHLVKKLKRSSPFVEYSVHPPFSKGYRKHVDEGLSGRSVVTGKAVTEVDTCLEDAASWLFDLCSRERMRLNVEENKGLPRIITSGRSNHVVLGTLRTTPFPLKTREFVSRMTWFKLDSTGKVAIIVQSIDERVDYGIDTKNVVRGSTTAYQVLEANGDNSCSFVLYQKTDAGGVIPISVMNSKILSIIDVAEELRNSFKRDYEVDAANRLAVVADLQRDKPGDVVDAFVDEDEKSIFDSVAESVSIDGGSELKQVVEGNSDIFLQVWCCKATSLSSLGGEEHKYALGAKQLSFSAAALFRRKKFDIFLAEVVVDADIQHCVAWSVSKCSRQRTQSFFDHDGGDSRREIKTSRRHREIIDTYFEEGKLGNSIEKEARSDLLWKKCSDGEDYVVIMRGKDAVQISRREAAAKLEPLSADFISQTKFTTHQGDRKSTSSTFPQTKVVMKLALGTESSILSNEERVLAATRHLSELRKYFDQSVDIDRVRRTEFIELLKADLEVYTTSETSTLDEGMAFFSRFEGFRKEWIKMASPNTLGKLAVEKGDARKWGWATGMVRADAVEVLAYLQDAMRRAGMRRDDIEKAIVETVNNHNQLVYNWKRTPKIVSDRDFLGRMIWRAVGGDKFELVTAPAESAARPSLPDVVRARYPSAWRIAGSEDHEIMAAVDYVIHPDWCGEVPSWVSNFFLGGNLARITEVQDYFQRLRPLGTYDEKDGAVVGDDFMIKTTEEKKRGGRDKYKTRVARVVEKHVALKEFAVLHPWFPSLVQGMLSRRLVDMQVVKTKLENLSNREALTIGKSFSMTLLDRLVADTAVDIFVNEYVSLIELSRTERFFVPMAATIGQRKLERAPWGLIFSVGTGAVLSMLDVATDAYAISNFTMQGENGYAKTIIASVSISLAIQLLIVYGNGKKRGKWHVVKEMMIALSGFKPVVDTFRVIGGAKAHADDAFNPMFELLLAKMVEIVAESIPSSLVQIYALLMTPTGSGSTASIASIIVSIATISLGSTTMCFDFDLDPERRMHTPNFYGYVPSSSGQRTLVFYSMFFFTVCHVTVRLLGIALLAAVSPPVTAVVLGGDILFFMIFKLARNDLRYWVKLPGALSWFVSIVVRLFMKLMVDFTVMVQLRHPQECGGLYWCTCLLLGQATSFAAVYLYYSASAGSAKDSATSTINLWALMVGLETAFVVFFAIFVSKMDHKFRVTFFSTKTGSVFNQNKFRTETKDEARIVIFGIHPSYYEGIRGEVEQWVRESWGMWNEERPGWFTETVKASVPIDMIPTN